MITKTTYFHFLFEAKTFQCMKFLCSFIEAAVIANGEGHRCGYLLLLQALETG